MRTEISEHDACIASDDIRVCVGERRTCKHFFELPTAEREKIIKRNTGKRTVQRHRGRGGLGAIAGAGVLASIASPQRRTHGTCIKFGNFPSMLGRPIRKATVHVIAGLGEGLSGACAHTTSRTRRTRASCATRRTRLDCPLQRPFLYDLNIGKDLAECDKRPPSRVNEHAVPTDTSEPCANGQLAFKYGRGIDTNPSVRGSARFKIFRQRRETHTVVHPRRRATAA